MEGQTRALDSFGSNRWWWATSTGNWHLADAPLHSNLQTPPARPTALQMDLARLG